MMIVVVAALTLLIWQRWIAISQFRLRWGVRRELRILSKIDSRAPEALHYKIRTTFFLVQLVYAIDRHLWRSDKARAARQLIVQDILLPRAKKIAKSRWPARRALALSCFRLHPRVEEEKIVLELMKDPVPVIRVGATRVALKIGTTESVNAILDFLILQKRYVRNLLRVSVREASEDFVEKIRTRLRSEQSKRVARICLDLISSRLKDELDGEWVSALATSDDRNLRISALRALSRSGCTGAYPALSHAITDPEWEVRAAACRLMGEHQFVQGLSSLVTAAHDKHWWVRRNSAFALARMGIAGEHALQELLKDSDKFSSEIARSAIVAAKKAA